LNYNECEDIAGAICHQFVIGYNSLPERHDIASESMRAASATCQLWLGLVVFVLAIIALY